MPRKRTHGKRRIVEAHRDVWEAVFDAGYDFFDELPDIGVSKDAYGRPDAHAAQDAWQRFGREYLLTHDRTGVRGEPIWALRQFGEPLHAD